MWWVGVCECLLGTTAISAPSLPSSLLPSLSVLVCRLHFAGAPPFVKELSAAAKSAEHCNVGQDY